MVNISRYTVKRVKEDTGRYDLDSKQIKDPDSARNIIETVLDLNASTVENLGLLTVDIKLNVIGIHIVTIGSLNSSIVHPRDIFQRAILDNAHQIILFHNHPSGDPRPSNDDIGVTRRVAEAGEILGVPLADHIIVGDGRYTSLKEEGLF